MPFAWSQIDNRVLGIWPLRSLLFYFQRVTVTLGFDSVKLLSLDREKWLAREGRSSVSQIPQAWGSWLLLRVPSAEETSKQVGIRACVKLRESEVRKCSQHLWGEKCCGVGGSQRYSRKKQKKIRTETVQMNSWREKGLHTQMEPLGAPLCVTAPLWGGAGDKGVGVGPSANARDWNRGGQGSVVLNTMGLRLSPVWVHTQSAVEWPKQKSEKVTLETDPRLRSSNEVWVYRKWSRGAQRNHRGCKSSGGYLPRKATEHVLAADPALITVAVTT